MLKLWLTRAAGDISDASVFTDYAVPKMYLKLQYCVSCAIHGKIVRYELRPRRHNRISPNLAAECDPEKAGGTELLLQESDTTKTERRSILSRQLRLPKDNWLAGRVVCTFRAMFESDQGGLGAVSELTLESKATDSASQE